MGWKTYGRDDVAPLPPPAHHAASGERHESLWLPSRRGSAHGHREQLSLQSGTVIAATYCGASPSQGLQLPHHPSQSHGVAHGRQHLRRPGDGLSPEPDGGDDGCRDQQCPVLPLLVHDWNAVANK